jgi:hypothetical protein
MFGEARASIIYLAAFLFLGSACTKEASVHPSYPPINVKYVKRRPVGDSVQFRAILLPAGGGYWNVFRSADCRSGETIRISSKIPVVLKNYLLKAQQISNDRDQFYVLVDVNGTVSPAETGEDTNRSVIIRDFEHASVIHMNCQNL